ncbi:hypothetical protein VTP01DRAFT_8856 [Rhizomucor pusillus]|uniref:uncharacterized protein n=1 Tax=Rhizomucor pusillus TaxID=4840 RepID=UPI00374426C8
MSVQATIALLNKNANATPKSAPPIRQSNNRSTEKTTKTSSSTSPRTSRTTNAGIASILSKFDPKAPVTTDERPPLRKNTMRSEPSLRRTATQTTKSTHDCAKSVARINAITDELVAMYQDLLDKCVEKTPSTAKDPSLAQIQEYETRIKELTKELEESAHARKELERKLERYTHQSGVATAMEKDHPPSVVVNNKEEQGSPRRNTDTDEELLFSKRHLADVEKGAQIMLARQARDLETERLQTRALKQVIFKQDKLVTALEARLSQQRREASDKSALLMEQLDLQRIELEDKQALLAKLLDEKEELLLRLTMTNKNNPISYSACNAANTSIKMGRRCSASIRSSIDVLAEMIESDIRFADVTAKQPTSRSSTSSRGSSSFAVSDSSRPMSPPLSGPPRDPLPPLPSMPSLSSIRTSGSMTTISSPTTSWSSVDSSTAALYAQLTTSEAFNGSPLYRDSCSYYTDSPSWPDLTIETVMERTATSSVYVSEDTTETCSSKVTKKSNNPAFWKGWKQRFGSSRQSTVPSA